MLASSFTKTCFREYWKSRRYGRLARSAARSEGAGGPDAIFYGGAVEALDKLLALFGELARALGACGCYGGAVAGALLVAEGQAVVHCGW